MGGAQKNIQGPNSSPASVVDVPMVVAVAFFGGDTPSPSELVSALPADCVPPLSLFSGLLRTTRDGLPMLWRRERLCQ